MSQPESTTDCDLEAATVCPMPPVSSEAPRNSPSIGSCLGEYVIESELARGGMGVIYVARHRVMDRRVAIKTLCTGLNRQGSERERLVIEAEAAAKLDHHGIVPIYEVGEFHHEPYLVMKLIEGENLAQRLQRGPMSVAESVQIGIELADAVAHAHQRGVIHRDLKPANILLDASHKNRPVITDFGIAKIVQSIRQRMTSAGEPIGTPHYMPPEQADQTRGPVGPQADVYSLGAVLYAALTGRPPFQAASAVDVVLQVLTKDPVPPRRLNATIPITLDAIVVKCLEKEPMRRYGSAGDLAQDLRNFAAGKPTIARPMNWLGWLTFQFRRHLLLATVSGSVVSLMAIACFVVAMLYLRSQTALIESQQQLADLNNVIATERMLFRTQLSRLQRREVGKDEFDAGRLADYAKFIAESNPALATRLALESIKLAIQSELTPDEFCVEWLKKAAQPDTADRSNDATPTSLAALVEQTESSLTQTGQSSDRTPLPWLGVATAESDKLQTQTPANQTTTSRPHTPP